MDIFIKDDKIFVAALKSQKINIYSKTTHELLDYFPKNVTQEDEAFIYQPMDIFLTDELIYVVDAGAYKVKIYTLEGEFVKSFGGFGKSYGQFDRPKSVTVDKEGNVFVVDSSLKNVQIFNTKGELLMFFGSQNGKFVGVNLPAGVAIDYDNIEYFKKP